MKVFQFIIKILLVSDDNEYKEILGLFNSQQKWRFSKKCFTTNRFNKKAESLLFEKYSSPKWY